MITSDNNDDVGFCRLEISFKETFHVPFVNLRKVIIQDTGLKTTMFIGEIVEVIKHFKEFNERNIKSLSCQVNFKPIWIVKTIESILSQAGVVYEDNCFCGPQNLYFEGIEQFQKDVEYLLTNFPRKIEKKNYSNGSNSSNKSAFTLERIHLNEEKIYPMFFNSYFKNIATNLIGQLEIDCKDEMKSFIDKLETLIEKTSTEIQSGPVDVDENVWNCVEKHNAERLKETLSRFDCAYKIMDGPHGNKQLVMSSKDKSAERQSKLDKALDVLIDLYQVHFKQGMTSATISVDKSEDFESVKKFLDENKMRGHCVYKIFGLKSKMENLIKTLKGGNKEEVMPEEKVKEINREPENEVKDKYKFESGLEIFISKGNLVHQRTDAIVNPANSRLMHGGGAAKAIADAAGDMLEMECKAYIDEYETLPLTMAMHTTAGNMRPNIKYVIHAVGPQVSRKEIDEKLLNKLRIDMIRTFFNCYKYANDVLKISSIAVPAISSGIFGVPIEIVGNAMFEAARAFEKVTINKVLKEIHFVNFDDKTVNNIVKAFKMWNEGSDVDGDLSKNQQRHDNDGNQEFNRNPVDSTSRHKDIDNRHLMNIISKKEQSPSNDNENVNKVFSSSHRSRNMPSVPMTHESKEDGIKLQQKDENSDNICAICMDKITSPEMLKCGHVFCKDCLADYNKKCNPKCPSCGAIYGKVTGNQPNGKMVISTKQDIRLQGYESCRTLQIDYFFDSGFQNETHPNPGRPYYGTGRKAYLPDNEEGREVANMLKKAFDNKLVFTIGRSVTTGHDDMVTWNDIHHKTSLQGGPYGYPDPTYLKRVTEELASKGIFPKNKSGK